VHYLMLAQEFFSSLFRELSVMIKNVFWSEKKIRLIIELVGYV